MTQLPETLEEALMAMPKFANEKEIAGVSATVQFDVSGDEPGTYTLTIDNGEVTVETGAADDPDLTISTPSDVWKGIMFGELNGAMAFMQGQFKADGDLNVLMNMQKWFETP